MLKSCTELHLSFSSFMNHRRHFLAQLSSELSPHLQNSRAFRSIKWRRTKRGISETKEGNVYFPFPLPSGERWIQWFRIYGITGKHQIDDFPHISITTTLCQWLDAMATHLLSDCSSNWISQGHVCPCSGLMLIYICINIGYYLFLYKLKKRILVSFHSPCLGSIFRLCIAQPTLWLFLFLIWWSIVFLISLYHLPMANNLHFGLDLLMMCFYFRKA